MCGVEEISIYVDISSRDIINELNEHGNFMQIYLTALSQETDAS